MDNLFEDWEGLAEEKNIKLRIEKNDRFTFPHTNSSLCQMMIQNVLVNALKYTGDGGKIIIKGEKAVDSYSLTIQDNGPGISMSLMDQVKEGIVFLYDAHTDKSGFGLQLIHKISAFLGIKIDINTGRGGTTVKFSFPMPH